MSVFALWPVVFYKNVFVFSNRPYFSKAYLSYFKKSYLNVLMLKYAYKNKYAYLDLL